MSPAARTPRSLAGATILQLVPALRDDPAGHAAVDIALTLLQVGRARHRRRRRRPAGRRIARLRRRMAADDQRHASIRCASARNARTLANLIAAERIDIVHAQSAGAAWSALAATHAHAGVPGHVVSRPAAGEILAGNADRGVAGARRPRDRAVDYVVAGDDRALQDSARTHHRHSARSRYRHIQPGAVSADRIAALRRVWGILPQMRVVLSPGRIAPWNGQMSMIDAARLLVGNGERNIAFVFAGDDRATPALHARMLRARAHARHRHAVPLRRPLRRHAGARSPPPTSSWCRRWSRR